MKTLRILPVLALMMAFAACQKNESETAQESAFLSEQRVSQDQNQADKEVEDVGNLQDEVMARNESVINGRQTTETPVVLPYDSCAVVTLTPKGNNPTGKIRVDFGSGCRGRDGRYRKGVIEWTFTDRLRKPGAVITTRFENYGIKRLSTDSYVMIDNSSSKITTNLNTAEPNEEVPILNLRREVNLKMRFPDNREFTYAGTHSIRLDLGQLGYRWDNVYTLLAGSTGTGTDGQGRSYTATATTDVIRYAACALQGIYKPVSGILTIQHSAKTKVVDFGTGNCDNTVTVTINGEKTRTRW